jgi:hypothetical protein
LCPGGDLGGIKIDLAWAVIGTLKVDPSKGYGLLVRGEEGLLKREVGMNDPAGELFCGGDALDCGREEEARGDEKDPSGDDSRVVSQRKRRKKNEEAQGRARNGEEMTELG